MPPLIEHADEQEEGARGDAVVHHLEDRSLQALRREGENPQHHESEVGHRSVRDQLLGIGLHGRHPRGVHDPDQPEQQDDRDHASVHRGARKEGDREAQEPVDAHLQEDPRQDHGSCRRSFHVGVRQPRVQREQRHLDGEGQPEGAEEPQLESRWNREAKEVGVGEGGLAELLLVQVDERDDRHQHEQRAGGREQEELHRRVDPALPAPDADDHVHRDQHHLPEHVEQEEVERHEDTQHAHHQDEEARVERPLSPTDL